MIVLFRSGLDPADDRVGLAMLRAARGTGARRLFASGPVEGAGDVAVVRTDKWHSREFLSLRNDAVLSGEGTGGPVHRDGRDLVCLARLVATVPAEAYVLVRGHDPRPPFPRRLLARLPPLARGSLLPEPSPAAPAGAPFRLLGPAGAHRVVFDGRSPLLAPLAAAAVDFFLSGAPYAIADYDLPKALAIAMEIARGTGAGVSRGPPPAADG